MKDDTLSKQFDPGRAVLAGLAGGAAYLAEQYLDQRLLRRSGDDLKLLGMLATRRDPAWRIGGLGMHTFNSVALALVYAGLVRNRLPGSPMLRGFILGQIENAALFPLVPLILDRYHPAIRSGDLERFGTPTYALQSLLRHVAYGAVLGAVYA
jgi:hypothetical protein